MKVENIMSMSIVTVEMGDNLPTIKAIFSNVHFHHLLVVEAGHLVGIISHRDLLKALSPKIGTVAETESDTPTLKKEFTRL